MALRRVFSQDADFKESMFARQIAVMKGQAWNVVETLKTPDHGPLELTRRTRVCVWDDIVDIPVAIPLRVPSAEMRRQTDAAYRPSLEQEEEMDISAANASAPLPQHDLLGLYSPTSDLPNPNRFELSRKDSSADVAETDSARTSSLATDRRTRDRNTTKAPDVQTSSTQDHTPSSNSGPVRSRTRSSLDANSKKSSSGANRRRYSFTARRGSTAFLYDGDESDGDLGYAAAEGMEGNLKKVIIERLETVKSQNPVFTWC